MAAPDQDGLSDQSILVVGRNARIWGHLGPYLGDDPRIVVCSSRQIYDLDPDLLAGRYGRAVLFSYSRDEAENLKLIRNLRRFAPDLIYISTLAARAAEMGYWYGYPRVKYRAERFCRDAGLFDRVRILRLGLVEATYDPAQVAGRWHHTGLEDLAHAIRAPLGEAPFGQEALTEVREGPFGSGVEKAAFAAYRRVLSLGPVAGVLLRPVDLGLRAIGWHWYGYHGLANRDLLDPGGMTKP